MVKTPYVDENGIRKGGWSEDEDNKLRAYVLRYGHWNWRELPRFSGLSRCGKSCRLRWMNYLKPGLKRGRFDHTEEELVFKLHQQLGNKWSAIAAKLPGRTDNEVKNYWNTHLKKRINDKNREAAHEQTTKPLQTTQNEGEQNSGSSITPDSNTSCLQDSLEPHHVPAGYSSTESSYSEMSNSGNLGILNSSMLEDHDNGLLQQFVPSHDSFWNDPFFTHTFTYGEASNSSIELSEVSTYGYSWYMEDVINSYDGSNFM